MAFDTPLREITPGSDIFVRISNLIFLFANGHLVYRVRTNLNVQIINVFNGIVLMAHLVDLITFADAIGNPHAN